MLQNWTAEFEQTLRELRLAIIQVNSKRLDLSLIKGCGDTLCCGLVLLLWLVCKLKAQTRRDTNPQQSISPNNINPTHSLKKENAEEIQLGNPLIRDRSKRVELT